MRGIFYNSQQAVCSIFESGLMAYQALAKSPNYTLDYSEAREIDYSYDFIVFNWHVTVNSWVSADMLASLKGKKFCVVTEVCHSGSPIGGTPEIFDYYIVLDPTISETEKIFGFPRPLEPTSIGEYSDKGFPVIGSFGFATEGKDWHKIVEGVQNEFDNALIRINIPPATYVNNHLQKIESIRLQCESLIYKEGIKFELTSNYMDKQELIRWCGENTLNCFMYNRSTNQPTGMSAVTDQAISSRRPLLVTGDTTFRHVLKYIKPYPEMSFKEAIEDKDKVEQMYADWSQENFYKKFEKILFAND